MASATAMWCVALFCVATSLRVICVTAAAAAAESFEETFDDGWQQRWTAATDDKYKGAFVVDTLQPDLALKVPKKALHYGLTAAMGSALDPAEGVVLQFEAKYASGSTCSGAYMKFYSQDATFKPAEVKEDTPYTVMFGPDVCGTTSKVHLILNHKSPKTGEIEEKHLKNPPRVKSDKKTHVYTAQLKPDNTFVMMVDGTVVEEGSLFEKFDPPINPPEEIPDPDDVKPDDWVDNPKMDDPDAVKPEDWVEDPLMDDMDAVKPEGWLDDAPLEISDPEAKKPEEWNDEEDGEWVAPTIRNPDCQKAPGCGKWQRPKKSNPEYKGPWKPPKIDNPDYKGEWKQKTMPNPDYHKDETPLKSMAPIAFLGFELWTMDENIFFDNVVVTKDAELAATYRERWTARNAIEKEEEEAEAKKQQEEAKKDLEESRLRALLELPGLSAVAPYLEPVVDFMEDQGPAVSGLGILVVSLLFGAFVRRCLRSRKAETDVGKRKKEDISEPDDADKKPEGTSAGDPNRDEDAGEEEEEEQETPKESRSRRSN